MKKAIRMTLYTFSGLFLIALITLFSLPFIMNPNDFKQEIEAAVKEQTGRVLTIEGDIRLSYFPWLGFSTQKIMLGNAKGFQSPYFAQIKQSQLNVRLIPLLSKKLEVSEIMFKGLQLHLFKNKQGQGNWEDLAKLGDEDDSKTPNPLTALAVAGLSIEDASVIWEDRQAGQRTEINNIQLKIGQLDFNEAIPLSLSLALKNKTPKLTQSLIFSSDFIINEALDVFQLKGMKLSLDSHSPLLPKSALMLNVSSDLSFDKAKQLLEFNALSVSNGALTLKADGQYSLNTKNLNISLALEKFNLEKVLSSFEVALPKALKSKNLSVSFASHLKLDKKTQLIQFKDLTLSSGGLTLNAQGNYHLKTENLNTSMALKKFNLEAILSRFEVPLPKPLKSKNLSVSFTSHLKVDNKKKFIQFKDLRLTGGGLTLNARGNYHLTTENLNTSLALEKFNLKNVLSTFGVVLPKKIQSKALTAYFFTDLAFNKQTQSLDFSQLNIRAGTLNLKAKGRYNVAHERINLTAEIDRFNAAALLPQLGLPLPKMTDKKALTKLSLGLKLQADKTSANIQSLQIEVDETRLQGNATVKNFTDPTVHFDVTINKLDADRYVPVQKLPPQVITPASSAALGVSLIPVKILREIKTTGQIFIGELKTNGVKIKEMTLKLDAKKGVVQSQQGIQNLYGGHYKGGFNLNVQTNLPVFILDEQFTQINIAPLLKDLKNETHFKGVLDVSAKFSGKGNTESTIKSSLNGQLHAVLTDGEVVNLDMQKMIQQGKALFKKDEADKTTQPMNAVFAKISATLMVENGLIKNENLLGESAKARLTGQGNWNLMSDELNYQFKFLRDHTKNNSTRLKDQPLIIKVAGTFKQPSYHLDLAAMLSEKHQVKIEKVLDKIEEKMPNKVQRFLKKIL
ncbi:MAG: AsmA family protein [Methylococcales bacterium]|nr:AsmA family protein [Methylococcales bacterium]